MPKPPLRLAELVAGLSLVSDLGKGLVDGQGLRACVAAMALAREAGLPPEEQRTTFWVALLRFVGCTATASQLAATLGDELAVSASFASADARDMRDVLVGTLATVGRRPDRIAGFLLRAPAAIREHETASCEVAQAVAGRLGLPEQVVAALGQVFERWDGKGHPGRSGGEDIPRAVRVWQVAHVADLLRHTGDPDAVAAELRSRAGSALDPALAALCADGLTERPAEATVADVLAAEPLPHREVPPGELDAVLGVFGMLADLKSPYFAGHCDRVAALAAAAATAAGCPPDQVATARRAGLLHDVGRVAISSRIWDKAGRLTDGEREQVELHSYYTQRLLARVPALAGLVDVACSHHERMDGSGYHRRLSGTALPPLAALLAAADAYVTAGEDRPHRAARSAGERAAMLRRTALPAAAVHAVLTAAGHVGRAPVRDPEALTDRERDVLALVARGLTNRAAGERLGVSPKTVNAHLEHCYAKLGVSTRAAAVVHAVQRGWLTLDGPDC